jgi:hypothetical protein
MCHPAATLAHLLSASPSKSPTRPAVDTTGRAFWSRMASGPCENQKHVSEFPSPYQLSARQQTMPIHPAHCTLYLLSLVLTLSGQRLDATFASDGLTDPSLRPRGALAIFAKREGEAGPRAARRHYCVTTARMSHPQPAANGEWFSLLPSGSARAERPRERRIIGVSRDRSAVTPWGDAKRASPRALRTEKRVRTEQDSCCATRSSRRSRANDAQCLRKGAAEWATLFPCRADCERAYHDAESPLGCLAARPGDGVLSSRIGL